MQTKTTVTAVVPSSAIVLSTHDWHAPASAYVPALPLFFLHIRYASSARMPASAFLPDAVDVPLQLRVDAHLILLDLGIVGLS